MDKKQAPIGLFDSGFGGLTVMREAIRLFPHEDLIYLGDTANLPYGNKSPEAIAHFSLENGNFLLSLGIKLLLIPCHTACCHALKKLQETLPIPVLGVVEPGLNLLAAKKRGTIGILGTQSTIESGLYPSLLKKLAPEMIPISIACPLFVPLIEEGFIEHPATEAIARDYLAPLQNKGVEAILLACTHYPLIRTTLQKVIGPTIELLEPAYATALQALQLLAERDLLNPQRGEGERKFFVSDHQEKFQKLGPLFLKQEIERIELKKIRIHEILASGLPRIVRST